MDKLQNRYGELMRELKVAIQNGLSAALYTQTTDVAVEVNGLMTYDRGVVKTDVACDWPDVGVFARFFARYDGCRATQQPPEHHRLIAPWPNGVTAKLRNQFVATPSHLIDIMATVIDLSGAKYPTEHNGQKIHPMEGVSLRPAFTGQTIQRPHPIFWEHEANRAVRAGKWKLVAKENQAWELYDIEADRTELNNVAAKQPDKVKELAAQWDTWAVRTNVLPLGTWRAQTR